MCIRDRTTTNEILHFYLILFCLFGFSQLVQKQPFYEVGTRTVIWWQVVSKKFAPKIIKICQFFFKSINNIGDAFWRNSVHFNSYFVGSVFLRYCRSRVVPEMFVPKIIKIGYAFFKWQSIMFGMFFSGHGVYMCCTCCMCRILPLICIHFIHLSSKSFAHAYRCALTHLHSHLMQWTVIRYFWI